MQFHEKLKELRKGRGFTQEELAERLHVSRSAVAKWENGLGLPNDDSLGDIATYFGVTREDLLADRATQTIIVEKNGLLSRQKKWLIILIAIASALFIASAVLLGVFLGKDKDDWVGGGKVEITGIVGKFPSETEKWVKGEDGYTVVYHLKTGETYPFYANLTWRGSGGVPMLMKNAVKIAYDTQLFTFDKGLFVEGYPNETPANERYPFYFTCGETPASTKILVTTSSWGNFAYMVNVIIEN